MLQQKWTRTAATALVALSLFAAPQLAMAGDHCGRRSYDDRGYGYRSGYQYEPGYYQDYRYSGYSNGYRNDGYSGHSDYGYRNDRYNGYSGTYPSDQRSYRDGYGDYRGYRSPGKSAAIIGGGAAAGAVIGGLAGGGKGAAAGAIVGGLGGLIYDRSTKNRGPRW